METAWEGPFGLIVAITLGLSVGSFANVLIHRLPREGLSVTSPARSFCPACGTRLAWFDNVPVLAWIVLRGRCRSCASPIAWRYPAVELLVGLLFAMFWWLTPPVDASALVQLGVALVLGTTCVVVSAIDVEHLIIPDAITWPGIVLGLLASLALPEIHARHPGFDPEHARQTALVVSVGGLLAGGGSLWLFGRLGNLLLKRQVEAAGVEDAMGWGDVKWMACAGTLLGALGVLDAILAACFVGAVVGLTWKLVARLRGATSPGGIPFGPFLSIGILMQLVRPGAAWWLIASLAPVPG